MKNGSLGFLVYKITKKLDLFKDSLLPFIRDFSAQLIRHRRIILVFQALFFERYGFLETDSFCWFKGLSSISAIAIVHHNEKIWYWSSSDIYRPTLVTYFFNS